MYSIKIATIITTSGALIALIFPEIFAKAFTSDAELKSITVRGLRISVSALPLVGIQIVSSSFFQSIGSATKSLIQSLSRQLIFLIPAIIILPRIFKLDGLWIAMPFSDIVSFILSLFLLIFQLRQLKKIESNNLL